jgi:hypothetical protein
LLLKPNQKYLEKSALRLTRNWNRSPANAASFPKRNFL